MRVMYTASRVFVIVAYVFVVVVVILLHFLSLLALYGNDGDDDKYFPAPPLICAMSLTLQVHQH